MDSRVVAIKATDQTMLLASRAQPVAAVKARVVHVPVGLFRAQEVSPAQAPELHAMIERLCLQADLPKPRIAIANDPSPNAFALGRSPKHATVCATTGLMDLLSPAELEGVMAHKLSHVANRDVAIMTLASFFASIASMIVQFGFLFGGGGGYGVDSYPGPPQCTGLLGAGR